MRARIHLENATYHVDIMRVIRTGEVLRVEHEKEIFDFLVIDQQIEGMNFRGRRIVGNTPPVFSVPGRHVSYALH